MILFDFVKNYVCPNTMIRLWVKNSSGHEMLTEENGELVCMEHQFLKGEAWQSKYGYYEVIGVTDIAVDDFYREAVNIVIKKREK